MAGISGALFASFQHNLSPDTTSRFGVTMSIYLLVYMVVGGKDYFIGPLVGTAVLTLLAELHALDAAVPAHAHRGHRHRGDALHADGAGGDAAADREWSGGEERPGRGGVERRRRPSPEWPPTERSSRHRRAEGGVTAMALLEINKLSRQLRRPGRGAATST